MISRENCRIGMKVYFGRPNGAKTLGVITKLNSKAKVKTLEIRGSGRGSIIGTEWGVPYSMLTPADTVVPLITPTPQSSYGEDKHIMQAIRALYNNLSPENLTCDGEISGNEVAQRSATYHRKLNALFTALGRHVSEEEAYSTL
jgi:hypothetical protein